MTRLLAALACVFALVVGLPARAHASALVDLQVDPPNPQVGELIHVRYTVRLRNESDAQAVALDFGQLELLSDPSPPQMPFMFGGGGGFAMSIDTSSEYTVRAPSPGRYVIGNARVINTSTGRVVAQHPNITLVITGGAPGVILDGGTTEDDVLVQSEPRDPDGPPVGDLTGAEYNPNGFLRVAVDPPRPYLGQQVTLRAWLYVSSSEAGCEVTQEPGLVGFWNETLVPPTRECAARWFHQNVGGRYMSVGLVRKIALFPSQTGTLVIGPMTAEVEALTGGLFRSVQRFETHSPPVPVEVREPPLAGRPQGYVPGTTGPITLSADVDRSDVAVGETVTVTVHASSEGSLASARVIPPANLDGVRVRTGTSREVHDTSTGRVVTTLTTELLVVPERGGRFDLGQIEIPYWDPVAERYDVARAALPPITARGAALPRESAGNANDASTALRALVPDPALRPHTALFTRGPVAPLVIFAPPVLLGLSALGTALSRRFAQRRKTRETEARTDPRVLVRAARRAMNSDPREAIALAGRALDRATAEVAREAEGGLLGLPPEVRATLDEARQACDAARFAGADMEVGEVVARVERAVRALEEAL